MAYFKKGQELFEAGDFARARLEFKNTLQIDDRYAKAWYMLGRVEQRGGEIQLAYDHFSRAVELAPELVGARISKAQILILAGELESAEDEIKQALLTAPQDVSALVMRGTLRKRQGDISGADADARAALAIDANNAAAAALLVSAHLDEGPSDEVVTVLRDAITANPEIPTLRLMLGQVYERQGNSAGVVQVLKDLVEHFPQHSGYRFRLASYLVKLERIDEAETVLRKTLAAMPTDFVRQRALLEFLARTDSVAAALVELNRMLKQQQGDVTALRFLKAELLAAAGESDKAEAVYRSLIADTSRGSPNWIKANNGLARLLIDDDRDTEATNAIKSVLQVAPHEPDVLQLRAELALKNGDSAQAIGDLRAVLDGYPDRAAAHYLLGLAHMQRDEDALAQDELEKAISLDPNEPAAYLKLAELRVVIGDNQGALTTLEQLLEKVPDNAAAQREIARIQLSNRDWDALGKTAERIKLDRPKHPLGYYLTGLVLQHRGKNREAVHLFNRALELDPNSMEPMVALARSQLALGEREEARRLINQVLELSPNELAAMTLLGEIHLANGKVAQAGEVFKEAVRSHPTSPRAYVRLAQYQVGQHEWDAAHQTLKDGIEATGENGYLILQLAMLLDESGEHEAAVKTYEDLLSRYPDALVAVNNLAALLANKANDNATLDYALKLAVRLKESDIPEFVDTLGWVYFQRREYVLALPYLEKAVAGKPEQPEMRYHLGMAYAKLGRLKEAKENLGLAANSANVGLQGEVKKMLQELDDAPAPSEPKPPTL